MLFFASADGMSLSHDLKFQEVSNSVFDRELFGSLRYSCSPQRLTLRLLFMTPEEIEGYTLANIDGLFDAPVSKENEEKALSALLNVNLRFSPF